MRCILRRSVAGRRRRLDGRSFDSAGDEWLIAAVFYRYVTVRLNVGLPPPMLMRRGQRIFHCLMEFTTCKTGCGLF